MVTVLAVGAIMKACAALSFGFTLFALEGLARPALAQQPQNAQVWYTPRLEPAPDDVAPAQRKKATTTPPPSDAGLPATQLEKRSHRGLVLAGALLFGASYAASFAFGVVLAGFQGDAGGRVSPESFWIPVAGPFVALAQAGQIEPWVLADGLAQTAGVAMMIVGVAWKQTVPHTSARVMLTPARVGGSANGLALAGTF